MRLSVSFTFICIFLCLSYAAKSEIAIIQKPIVFDEKRESLSVQYLKERHGIEQSDAHIDPKMVVVHWTVVPTLEKRGSGDIPS
jgi:hypothetical protein